MMTTSAAHLAAPMQNPKALTSRLLSAGRHCKRLGSLRADLAEANAVHQVHLPDCPYGMLPDAVLALSM